MIITTILYSTRQLSRFSYLFFLVPKHPSEKGVGTVAHLNPSPVPRPLSSTVLIGTHLFWDVCV